MVSMYETTRRKREKAEERDIGRRRKRGTGGRKRVGKEKAFLWKGGRWMPLDGGMESGCRFQWHPRSHWIVWRPPGVKQTTTTNNAALPFLPY